MYATSVIVNHSIKYCNQCVPLPCSFRVLRQEKKLYDLWEITESFVSHHNRANGMMWYLSPAIPVDNQFGRMQLHQFLCVRGAFVLVESSVVDD